MLFPSDVGPMTAHPLRRVLLVVTATALAAALPAPASHAATTAGPGTNYATDDAFTASRTAWWRNAGFGMFILFGDYSQWEGEYTRPDGTVCRNAEWIKRACDIPMNVYEAKAATFNPAWVLGLQDRVGSLEPGKRADFLVLDSDDPAMIPYRPGHALEIDEATRRSLEITRTLREGRRDGSLLDVLNRTITAMGSRLLADWLANPLTATAAIDERLAHLGL